LNIRKFVGANSRDALRLVREALGADAVVLSNRRMDDGSVEIVALADSDLAAITPKAPRVSASAGAGAGAPQAVSMNAAAGQQASASAPVAPRAMPTAQPMQPNPYASGMPDVFSSVFGASPEAGAENLGGNAADSGLLNANAPADEAPLAAAKPAAAPLPKAALPGAPKASPAAPQSQPISIEQPSARAPAAVAEAIKLRMEQVVNETVMSELSSMRDMMEEHFAGLLWGDRQRRNPARAALTKHLFAAGFSAQLVQMMVDNLPQDVEDMDGGMEWVRSVLASNLPVMEDEDTLMERGGVFALMGPTGVGKTTTTAKLAARCVMRFGASKVALLTTDSYRIGGHEQLRIFGKILGVSVHAVKDGADLQLALSELRNKHIVLIDTIGMSQRDRLVSDQIAMLCRAGQPVQRLLLLNATSHGDTLNEVVQAYQRAPDQQPLAGCILTKLDEATNLGGVLDTVIRYKLPVHYVSTGQKVPENLYVATKKFLIKSAFCIPRDHSPFVPHDDDIPALLSALSARSTAELHEVRFG
jgi:flagellar biosynthesis protein FlhF